MHLQHMGCASPIHHDSREISWSTASSRKNTIGASFWWKPVLCDWSVRWLWAGHLRYNSNLDACSAAWDEPKRYLFLMESNTGSSLPKVKRHRWKACEIVYLCQFAALIVLAELNPKTFLCACRFLDRFARWYHIC